MRRILLSIAVLALAASATGATDGQLPIIGGATTGAAREIGGATTGAAREIGGTTLEELVGRVEEVIPDTWRVIETDTGRAPIGWNGPEEGLYVMVEDTRTRFFHPNGFHYYSFYRVWLLPTDWEGEMRTTPYVSDSAPAFLLGVNGSYSVFFHTAGGNVWELGPKRLCDALGLTDICFTDLTRRVVDLEFETRLRESLASRRGEEADPASISPQHIIGLSGAGSSIYLEYIVPSEDGDRRGEGAGLATLTQDLADNVFVAFPEVDSLYLRRCRNDTYTDTIVVRD